MSELLDTPEKLIRAWLDAHNLEVPENGIQAFLTELGKIRVKINQAHIDQQDKRIEMLEDYILDGGLPLPKEHK